MIDQLNKDTAKRVKEWAISIGFKASNVSVRASSGQGGYIQLHIKHKKNDNYRAPLEWEKVLPADVTRRMLDIVYPNAKWLADNPQQSTAGNIFPHMAAMNVRQWVVFLMHETALQNSGG